MAAVSKPNAWHRVARLITKGDEKGMHAVPLLADDELSKHRRQTSMGRRIADPLLVVVVRRRVDDELPSGRVVCRCRLQITDV